MYFLQGEKTLRPGVIITPKSILNHINEKKRRAAEVTLYSSNNLTTIYLEKSGRGSESDPEFLQEFRGTQFENGTSITDG